MAPILISSRKNTLSIPQAKENKKAAIDILPPLLLLDPCNSTEPTESSAHQEPPGTIAGQECLYFAGMLLPGLFRIAHSLQFLAVSFRLANAKRL
ncbi:MAG: hypothetical protein WBF04_10180 [Candidatus Sulfotelmatobacter sp.]